MPTVSLKELLEKKVHLRLNLVNVVVRPHLFTKLSLDNE